MNFIVVSLVMHLIALLAGKSTLPLVPVSIFRSDYD
jgi:hypothetical protein